MIARVQLFERRYVPVHTGYECALVSKLVTDIKRVSRPFMDSRYSGLIYKHTQVY